MPFKDYCTSVFVKATKILCLILLCMTMGVALCYAQSEEELKLLRMFYKEADLFSSATHHPKSVAQIAENITIVTAKEIEAMNAHSVAEVLNRVPGLFVNFQQGIGSVGSTSLMRIQGAKARHTLVLVDGVPWNFLNGGSAETNTIPVGFIERIEIIKGPASSAWGSALGGVIHIITKPAGSAATPFGSVQASWGEMDTQSYSAQVSGQAGRLGYYLYGGRQDSDGPGRSRAFENNSFYAKLAYEASDGVNLKLSMGVSNPRIGLGEFDSSDIRSAGDIDNFWGMARIDAQLADNLLFNGRLFNLNQKSDITNKALGLGIVGGPGDLYQKSVYDEATTGGSADVVWKGLRHTTVLGVEVKHGALDQTIDSGQWLQTNQGAPAQLCTGPTVRNEAIYLNTTLMLGRLSVTPGVRYDTSSITDNFISPSLGFAYKLSKESLLRGSVARGFTAPPLSWASGGGLFLDPNPSLENEKAWTYQIGWESASLRYVWVKATLFRHDVEDLFTRQPFAAGPPGFNDLIVNSGSSRRQGVEVEVETLPAWDLTLKTGFGYVHIDPADSSGETEIYTHNIAITYDNPRIIRAELFGHFVRWDAQNLPELKFGNYIWDLNLAKQLISSGDKTAELFLTARNLFGGDQFVAAENPNPDSWVEAGVRIKF